MLVVEGDSEVSLESVRFAVTFHDVDVSFALFLKNLVRDFLKLLYAMVEFVRGPAPIWENDILLNPAMIRPSLFATVVYYVSILCLRPIIQHRNQIDKSDRW